MVNSFSYTMIIYWHENELYTVGYSDKTSICIVKRLYSDLCYAKKIHSVEKCLKICTPDTDTVQNNHRIEIWLFPSCWL